MTEDELGRLYPISLIQYDTNWPVLFKKEKKILKSIFGLALKIEHIGSTAVRGLMAKPTIDILLEKESYHIHRGPHEQNWLWDRVYFRDYLNKNPAEAQRYEKMKKDLAHKYKNDREAYTDGKAEYINRITEEAKKEL